MSNQPNANCLVCGKAYHVCRDCKNANSWRFATCCPSHFQVRAIFLDYRDGVITLDTARAQMARVGSLDISEFKDGYKKFFDLLYSKSIPEPEVAEAVDEIVIEPEAVVPKKRRTKKTDDETMSEA